MKLNPRLQLFVALMSVLTAGLHGQKEPAKKPVLRMDPSAVSEGGRPGLVVSYADMVEPVQRAVVSVYSTKIVTQRRQVNPLFRQFFPDQVPPERESREQGLGSGVIVSADGYILTNNHVVEGADELNISLPDEREFKAKLIGSDPSTDVAVIKIDAANLPFVTLADSDKLRVGDVVFAVGNPLGIGQTVTMGIVSALGRNNLGLLDRENGQAGYENFIQTDASINMGNSGGALADAKGRLVGINTAIMSTTRGNIGIGFAIPINLASSIMHSLIETGSVSRGFLGVGVETLNGDLAEALGLKKDAKGVLINNVTPDSPADKAGLKRGDAILAINDRPITSLQDLRLFVSQLAPGTEVKVRTFREGKERVLEVKLASLADAGRRGGLFDGVKVELVNDEMRTRLNLDERVGGLVVTEVEPTSPYADKLLPNMVIIEINREPVESVNGARESLKPGPNLLLVYFRGRYSYIGVPIAR
ncbi:MAG: Do family serine endopeptidase [Opitutaceae bacterium]|jgi:serine protease Do|nr:Do family serine endopeptidase [Opitutaceae bacterium]